MDGMGDEVAPADAIDGSYCQGKDGEYLLKAGSGSELESHEMTIPTGGQYHGSFSSAFATIVEGKNTGRNDVSQQACASSHHVDGAGVMVEELTLKDYNGENLAIVGTSNNRDRIQIRQTPWQHLYQIAGVLETSSSQEDALHKDYGQANSNGLAISNAWEGVGRNDFSELWGQNPPDDDCNEEMEHLSNNGNKAVASNDSMPRGGIRTKILSSCGFSEYFVKNTLKGKGVIYKGPHTEAFGRKLLDKTNSKAPMVALNAPSKPKSKSVLHSPRVADLFLNAIHERVSLREFLKAGHCKANKVERLYIFRQIVELVDISHSQGVVLRDLQPSRFNLLPSNQVIYNGKSVWKEISDNFIDQGNIPSSNDQNEKRPLENPSHAAANQMLKRPKLHQFPSRSGFRPITANDFDINIVGPQNSWNELNKEHYQKRDYKSESNSSCIPASNMPQLLPNAIDILEEKWYSSPEELSGQGCAFSSNIYVLGVFLFELLGSFDSERARAAAMSDLRHRILPPNFLSENPKEAGFCLWLLHPDPSSRPPAREVLQSDVISGIDESLGDEMSSSIDQDETESELLSHFLLSLKEHKQKDRLKLVEEIKCLEADIEEVERRQSKKPLALSCSSKKSIYTEGNRSHNIKHSGFQLHPNLSSGTDNELRLMKNISQLESAYFSMRSNIQFSDNHVASRSNKELLKERDNMHQGQENEGKNKPIDRLGAFFSGLCKYARYSKFEVRGTLRNGDFQNSTNVICSLSFDRDQEYFAAAGVSKRIKIYEFQALFNEAVDIHYPAIEMLNRSKLSWVCWNSYIRNYLASTDYDGIVKLWDAGTGQGFSQYIEHNKRAWSVDFSPLDPTKLASGSDDGSVKLWSINERNSLSTIRNVANVCCVQFSSHSTHLLAFGTADYKISCYDLRKVSSPWCILAGHDKAVSYVKFLDSETIVSASTDNTLKLWDLNKTSSTASSIDACISTLRGHTNQKNFVGLSVADGYIACGSETNEVYSYYRFLPMPITSHKFGSIDPISGKETDDDNGLFVSSVCWRQKSDMLVAANSSGCIKVLQMV